MTEIAPSISIPYLLIHGRKDDVCLLGVSEEFHGLTSSVKKRFELYDGKHESLNETQEDLVNLAVGWIKSFLT